MAHQAGGHAPTLDGPTSPPLPTERPSRARAESGILSRMAVSPGTPVVAPISVIEHPPARPSAPSAGRSVPRPDAPAKIAGLARCTDDVVVPGAWHAVAVRSTEPHARLLGIGRDPAFDWSRAVAGPVPTS